MRGSIYLPEGKGPLFPFHQPMSVLESAKERKTVLQGTAIRCDSKRNLHITFGGYEGIIPRQEAVHPGISGADRDIAILSRVGQHISFTITDIAINGDGKPKLILSRRAAQQQALEWLMKNVHIGTVLPARVTHLANFGAFVDLGCGVISLIPLENLSVSRISHPSDRLRVGQDILVVVTGVEKEYERFYLSHKELLGTWLENAAAFSPGDTVTGIIRDIREYGAFIELTPNLSGLADLKAWMEPGHQVSVYIKSIRSDGHKIKLQAIQDLGDAPPPSPPRYFITDGTVENWVY